MSSETHHPSEFAAGLGAKLATRSRHVCTLLGAGASRACGLPDVSMLETAIATALPDTDRERFKEFLVDRNLEEVLSRLRRTAALLESGQELGGLSAEGAKDLDAAICTEVVKQLSLKGADLEPMRRFAAWASRAEYHDPLEIFTVNYDLLIETTLEEIGALWFDGFVGAIRAPFRVDLVEESAEGIAAVTAAFVRLWKLHGSLNWAWRTEPAGIVRLGEPAADGKTAAIYPADTKYEESRRVPFVVLMDRFRRALREPETLLLVSGYAFGDEHLDEMIYDAALHCPRSEFVVFCHSKIPDRLAEKAEKVPSLSVVSATEAILSTHRGLWDAEEDTPGLWTDGALALADFGGLASFLASASGLREEVDE